MSNQSQPWRQRAQGILPGGGQNESGYESELRAYEAGKANSMSHEIGRHRRAVAAIRPAGTAPRADSNFDTRLSNPSAARSSRRSRPDHPANRSSINEHIMPESVPESDATRARATATSLSSDPTRLNTVSASSGSTPGRSPYTPSGAVTDRSHYSGGGGAAQRTSDDSPFGRPSMRGRLTQEYEARRRAIADRRVRASNPSSIGLTANSSRASFNIISNVPAGAHELPRDEPHASERATSNHSRYSYDILSGRDRSTDPNAPLDPRVRRAELEHGRENKVTPNSRRRIAEPRAERTSGNILAYDGGSPDERATAAREHARLAARQRVVGSHHHRSSSDGYAYNIIAQSSDLDHVDRKTYVYGDGGGRLHAKSQMHSGSSTARARVDHLDELYHNREPLYPDRPRGKRRVGTGHGNGEQVKNALTTDSRRTDAPPDDPLIAADTGRTMHHKPAHTLRHNRDVDHMWYTRPDPSPPARRHKIMPDNAPNVDSVSKDLPWLTGAERRAYDAQRRRDESAAGSPRRRGRKLVAEPDHMYAVLHGERNPRRHDPATGSYEPHPPPRAGYDDASSPRRPARRPADTLDSIGSVLAAPPPGPPSSYEERFRQTREQEESAARTRRDRSKASGAPPWAAPGGKNSPRRRW
ncbi:uncharacterized protein AMSG_06627, partial [Thecamonas trahens ATCC 50062]